MDASYNPLLMLAGGGACAVVGLKAAWAIAGGQRRRRLRRQSEVAGREAFRRRLQSAAAEARARRDQGLAWQGLRELRVSAVVDECRGVKSFYLAAPDGRPLPAYQPGQYLTIHLPRSQKGGASGGGKPIVRCYTLSDRPREEYYRITVKQCPPPASAPEAPPGVGSTMLHQSVGVGSVLLAAAPRGDFFLPACGDDPVVLIGAGIGVTPLVSMLLAQSHAGQHRDTYLLLGMRNGREHPFKNLPHDLASEGASLRTFVAYSRPELHDVEFRDYQHRGRLDLEYLRSVLPSNNFRFYLCGPPGLMQSLVPGLLDWGVPDDRIHFEAFGPASISRDRMTTAAKEAIGAEVRFARSGLVAQWSGEDKTLLDLAERCGVALDAGCRVGNCGACATRVMEGGATPVKAPGAPVDSGECLTCVSVPKGSLVLDA